MIEWIKLPSKKFDVWGKKNKMGKLTNDTVVICQNPEIKKILTTQFINGKNKMKLCGNTKEKPKCGFEFLLRAHVYHGAQRIVLSVEPAEVFQSFEAVDIWFAGYQYKDGKYTDVIEVYPFSCYKDYKKYWKQGMDKLYLNIVCGKIGCYTGEWVKDGHSD